MQIPHLKKALSLGAAILALTATSAFAAPAVANGSVNVRSGPGTSYRIVDQLRPGERVNLTRRTGSWCYVTKAGPSGWVSCAYLGGNYRPTYPVYPAYPTYDDYYAPDLSFNFGFGFPGGHQWWNHGHDHGHDYHRHHHY